MAILNDQVRQQLRDRFTETLKDPVHLTLYTRPGTGRLILPSGLGCATCDDARSVAEELSAAESRYKDTPILDYINKVQTDTVTAALAGSEYASLPVLSIAAPFSRAAARFGHPLDELPDALGAGRPGQHAVDGDSGARHRLGQTAGDRELRSLGHAVVDHFGRDLHR